MHQKDTKIMFKTFELDEKQLAALISDQI